MNYWKHSLLAKKKFGGIAEDYLPVHKFLDSSKLFYFDIRHRILLHHTYGIELCIQKFGDKYSNSEGKTVLVRDIAAEHCKEDLLGVVPTLNNWFKYTDPALSACIKPLNPHDRKLKEFVLYPLHLSGIKASLMITHSNFGIWLARELLGPDYATELAGYIGGQSISELLGLVKLNERWQYTPDLKQLKQIQDEPV